MTALLLAALAGVPTGPAGVPAGPADLPRQATREPARLLEADVRVELDGTGAAVDARYLLQGGDSVRFHAIRLPGHTLRVDRLSPAGAGPVRPLEGLHRFVLPPPEGAGGAREVTLRYRVEGARRRIPLFVPDAPAVPDESRISIRVAGAGPGIAPQRAFPRLAPDADGALAARPANLPGFVLLPPEGRTLTVDRAADWAAVLLVLAGSGYWWWWRRRGGREETAEPGSDDAVGSGRRVGEDVGTAPPRSGAS